MRRSQLAKDEGNDGRRKFFQRALGLTFLGGLLAPFTGLRAAANAPITTRANTLSAGANPFIGEIAIFGFNFAPLGWAKCDGQLLQISQNTALFSLLGTMYGGDGEVTFALPDCRGRVPIHHGTGPGLAPRIQGQKGGSQNMTGVFSHTHTANVHQGANTGMGDDMNPTGRYPAQATTDFYADASNTNLGSVQITTSSTGSTGASNEMPYLTLNFCIALDGTFPS